MRGSCPRMTKAVAHRVILVRPWRRSLRPTCTNPTVPAMSTPVIGITLDREEPGGYSKFPWLALRENYCRAVSKAGGLPVLLPHETERVEEYLALIHGLIVSGGAFDIDPALFGAAERHATVTTKDARTAFEWAITRGALDRDMPVLGICGGQQLLHVVLGGTLIQHIPDEVRRRAGARAAEPARSSRGTGCGSSTARCCTASFRSARCR